MLSRDAAELRIVRHEDHRVERHLGGIEELAECVEAAGRLADCIDGLGRPAIDECHGSFGRATEAPTQRA